MAEIHSTDYHDYVINNGRFIGEFEQMYQNIEDPWGTVKYVDSLKNDLLLALVSHIHRESPVERVLHAGCSLGALTNRLRIALDPIGQIWGCDISESAIAKARAQNPGIQFFTHDLGTGRLPFEDGFFDLVVMAETVWYVLPWLEKVLSYLNGALRAGGHLLIQQYFLQPGQQTYGNDILETPDDLLKFVAAAGFTVKHQISMDPESNHSFSLWATAS